MVIFFKRREGGTETEEKSWVQENVNSEKMEMV